VKPYVEINVVTKPYVQINVVMRKSLYVADDVYPIDELTLFATVRKIDVTGLENLLEVFDRQRVKVGWDAHGNLRKRVL
jgi:hypothetical protein